MNGSDMPPSVGAYDPYVGDPKVEQGYLDIEAQLQWPNPVLSNASEKASTITGETGVKMLGPYEWVPPIYWETDEDRQAGGAWSFATEISPGPAVPPLDSLEQMLGSDHLWPMDETWIYHTGGGPFHSLEVFTAAMNARYGPARSVADYAEKSQIMAYESHRAMFEAYGANKYTSTGVIQWMLNNAWPSMIWHLYDNYLRPGGSYFGAKIALEPLHIQYSYANNAVVVVNSTLQAYPDLSATADIYDLDGKKLYTAAQTVSVDADGVAEVLSLEEAGELPVTYLLRLTLAGADGQVASQNTYWLSTSPEAVDWDNTDWYVTPTSSYADFTTLQSVAPATLSVSDTTEKQDPDQVQTVTVTNTGTTVAYFVHLKVTQGEGGAEVLPALWQDNYFILLPGESRTITVRYRLSDLGDATPLIVVDTWNDLNAK
jgi:exo-1,4-beta-D-glucosaminidase